MTEAEWLTCTDPQPMLRFLRGQSSERKLRLFAVACCRRLGEFLLDERVRSAVEVAERFADGTVGQEAREDAKNEADEAALELLDDVEERRIVKSYAFWSAARAAHAAVCTAADPDGPLAERAAEVAAAGVECYVRDELHDSENAPAALQAEKVTQAELVRDLFGPLPFRTVTINPLWLAWNGGTVVKLAQGIYDDRGFDRLPVLADALEEASCTDPDLLGHCREPGPHVRGCWILDRLLGKE
jgi:hypothetical protein